MLDEHIAWNDHIHAIEKKLAKNIGLLYRARQFLDKESLKTIYFSYIHSYLNYANIAWASTYFTKLKTIHYQQKHAAIIVFKTLSLIIKHLISAREPKIWNNFLTKKEKEIQSHSIFLRKKLRLTATSRKR